uniref:G_PROTEIN_RECEP_F1_2 domain-containing protein n=1 Tax=Syphacia muris TaxID=451379 RepID=A0A0N5AZ89_9BILA
MDLLLSEPLPAIERLLSAHLPTEVSELFDLNNATTSDSDSPAAWQTWGIGLLIVAITAFGPSLAILGVPFLNKTLYERFMNFLVALGVGTLSGSTLYILVPQAFGFGDGTDDSYLLKSSIIIAAVYAFFAFDRALAYLLHYLKSRSAKRKMHKSTLDAVLQQQQRNISGSTTASVSILENENNNNDKNPGDMNILSIGNINNNCSNTSSVFKFDNVPQITISGMESDNNDAEKSPTKMNTIFEIEKNQLKLLYSKHNKH